MPDGDRVIVYRQQYFGFFTLLEHTEIDAEHGGQSPVPRVSESLPLASRVLPPGPRAAPAVTRAVPEIPPAPAGPARRPTAYV